jgi:hypothetical protein
MLIYYFRSFKTPTLPLDISLKVDPFSDLPLYTLLLLPFGSRILMFYSSIAHIKPTDSTCHC